MRRIATKGKTIKIKLYPEEWRDAVRLCKRFEINLPYGVKRKLATKCTCEVVWLFTREASN